jgi:HlyD family secretion protein
MRKCADETTMQAARPPPSGAGMSRRRLVALAALGGVLLLAGLGGVYLRWLRALPVPIATVQPAAVTQRVLGPGTVQARVPLALAARMTAQVTRIDADVGDGVKSGQVLIWLDDRDLATRRAAINGQAAALARHTQAAQAAVAKAEADLTLARGKQRRDAELLRTGFLSPAALEASDAALAVAQAGLDNTRATLAARVADASTLAQEARFADAQLSFTRLAAPMDGIVIARLAEVGSVVAPGAPLLRIVDPARLWVAVRVDESQVARVQVGQRARIRLRSGELVAGTVARIARLSDAATRELDVHVAFDAVPARFAIDQEAQVSIDTGAASGPAVPVAALVRDAQGHQGVWWVDEDNRARFRAVRTGTADEQHALVAEGLQAGERIVVREMGLREGQRVSAAR